MTSVIYLRVSMQEEGILRHSNSKCHVFIIIMQKDEILEYTMLSVICVHF